MQKEGVNIDMKTEIKLSIKYFMVCVWLSCAFQLTISCRKDNNSRYDDLGYKETEINVFKEVLPFVLDTSLYHFPNNNPAYSSEHLVLRVDGVIGPIIAGEVDSVRKITSDFNRYFRLNDMDTTSIRQLAIALIDSISSDGFSVPDSLDRIGRFELRTPAQKISGRYMEAGTIKLSRVSLNSKRNEALFYYEYSPEGNALRRVLCFARKEGGVWKKRIVLLF